MSAVDVAQRLIRFDTTNPPGNEAECITYVHGLLADAGIDARIIGGTPERPNLVARIAGSGMAAPLLLHGHVDVVTTAGQKWSHSPFAGDIADGQLWGRGALDMKGGVAAILAALLRMKANGTQPAGDVIVAIVVDEETGSDAGAGWLVRQHPELFDGVRYAIGEGGGRSFVFAGRRFYPIAVAEKRVCWMKATLTGRAGHGSTPIRGGAMAKLGHLLRALDQTSFPVHVTEPARMMVAAMADALSGPIVDQLNALLDPDTTEDALRAVPQRAEMFNALLHNTVTASVLRGSDKINVIPAEIEVGLDGRLLPGFNADDMLQELRRAVDAEMNIEIVRNEVGSRSLDTGLYPLCAETVLRMDPEGLPIPSMVAGFTDGCQFAKLGIQTYGFLPVRLPDEGNLDSTIHGADERVPTTALEASAESLAYLLTNFGRVQTRSVEI